MARGLPDLEPVGAWLGDDELGEDATGASIAATDLDSDGEVEVAIGQPLSREDLGVEGGVRLVRGLPDGQVSLSERDDLWFQSVDSARVGTDTLFAALGPDPEQIELVVSGGGELPDHQGGIWALDPLAQGTLQEADAVRSIRGPPGLGYQIAALDLDGDGQLDLVASGSDGVGFFAGPWTTDLQEQDRDAAWSGDILEDDLGSMLEAVGDLDGDGHDDLAVGAPQHHEPAERAGRMYLVPGGALPHSGVVDALESQVRGEAVGDGMGWAAAGMDVDGDAQLDLLVSAGGVFPGPATGEVLLFVGPVCPASRTAGDAALRLQGESEGDMFGRALAVAGADLVVGAQGAPRGVQDGVVYLVPGAALQP